jgi:hypothetical protein
MRLLRRRPVPRSLPPLSDNSLDHVRIPRPRRIAGDRIEAAIRQDRQFALFDQFRHIGPGNARVLRVTSLTESQSRLIHR